MLQIKKYVYVFVRKDLPLSQQIVQSNHASLEAGIKFGSDNIEEPSSLILISVKNKAQLEKALEDLKTKEIKTVSFYEPDWDYGFTAFATEPLTIDKKQLLKMYQLWK